MLTAGIGFHGLGTGPFTTLIVKCAVGRVVPLLVFGTDGKLENWGPDGGIDSQDG